MALIFTLESFALANEATVRGEALHHRKYPAIAPLESIKLPLSAPARSQAAKQLYY
jgi:hypothetical protein